MSLTLQDLISDFSIEDAMKDTGHNPEYLEYLSNPKFSSWVEQFKVVRFKDENGKIIKSKETDAYLDTQCQSYDENMEIVQNDYLLYHTETGRIGFYDSETEMFFCIVLTDVCDSKNPYVMFAHLFSWDIDNKHI
tara:strand:- start:285 stop:689 length:405 start_codon:yes stop_codon:yes gene_type:complete